MPPVPRSRTALLYYDIKTTLVLWNMNTSMTAVCMLSILKYCTCLDIAFFVCFFAAIFVCDLTYLPVQLYSISAFDADGSADGTKGWAISCGVISTVISGVLAFLQVF